MRLFFCITHSSIIALFSFGQRHFMRYMTSVKLNDFSVVVSVLHCSSFMLRQDAISFCAYLVLKDNKHSKNLALNKLLRNFVNMFLLKHKTKFAILGPGNKVSIVRFWGKMADFCTYLLSLLFGRKYNSLSPFINAELLPPKKTIMDKISQLLRILPNRGLYRKG